MVPLYYVVFVTVPDKKTADALSKGLVQRKLAACVNIVPGVSSVYWWEGKIQHSEELLLIIKTRAGLLPVLTEFVKKNHPYTVPEVIAMDLTDGSEAYLNWLGSNTLFTKPRQPEGARRTGHR
jgi:periplasmic divalent cation tolerance protein